VENFISLEDFSLETYWAAYTLASGRKRCRFLLATSGNLCFLPLLS
jgi:hypothetical protein